MFSKGPAGLVRTSAGARIRKKNKKSKIILHLSTGNRPVRRRGQIVRKPTAVNIEEEVVTNNEQEHQDEGWLFQ